MRLHLFALAALVLSSCTSAPGGGGFFQTTPHRYALDQAAQAAPTPEAQEAAEARVAAAREANSMSNGGRWAEVEIQGRIVGDGELSVARDSLGRVRRVSLTTETLTPAGEKGTWAIAQHWFGEDGSTVGFTHVHQTHLPGSCERSLSGRAVDLLLDSGRLVSVDRRSPVPVTDCTPAYPAGLTALVFPDAASLLAASGVSDLDALTWTGDPPPPASPRRN